MKRKIIETDFEKEEGEIFEHVKEENEIKKEEEITTDTEIERDKKKEITKSELRLKTHPRKMDTKN